VVARTLAHYYRKPLIPTNHALGHVELGCLLTGAKDPLILLVSGGHTMILTFLEHKWRVFGETLDITVGQLLDQFGRFLGFASPCGVKIEELASSSEGRYIPLPYTVKGNDVSFSGLLTAAKAAVKQGKSAARSQVCYSVQETAFSMLAETVERATAFTGKQEIVIVGGVAANKRLAKMLEDATRRHGSKALICPGRFAGDNGVQIAWTALLEYASTNKSTKIERSFVRQSWRLDTVNVSWRQT
jgi:N6-L-threonylcarbamoyladenine synthase